MSNGQSTQGLMKAGVLIAAAIIVVRIILEQLGTPEMINNIFGVTWLYLIMPVLFALRLLKSGETSPYKALFKNVTLFGIYTRLMVMVTYMAAYQFGWAAPRFGSKMGGNVGPDITPLQGYLIIPGRNLLVWVVIVAVIGMVIGGITLRFRRRAAS